MAMMAMMVTTLGLPTNGRTVTDERLGEVGEAQGGEVKGEGAPTGLQLLIRIKSCSPGGRGGGFDSERFCAPTFVYE